MVLKQVERKRNQRLEDFFQWPIAIVQVREAGQEAFIHLEYEPGPENRGG